jgi:hypothetical protein
VLVAGACVPLLLPLDPVVPLVPFVPVDPPVDPPAAFLEPPEPVDAVCLLASATTARFSLVGPV